MPELNQKFIEQLLEFPLINQIEGDCMVLQTRDQIRPYLDSKLKIHGLQATVLRSDENKLEFKIREVDKEYLPFTVKFSTNEKLNGWRAKVIFPKKRSRSLFEGDVSDIDSKHQKMGPPRNNSLWSANSATNSIISFDTNCASNSSTSERNILSNSYVSSTNTSIIDTQALPEIDACFDSFEKSLTYRRYEELRYVINTVVLKKVIQNPAIQYSEKSDMINCVTLEVLKHLKMD